jgi:hypothetical protein
VSTAQAVTLRKPRAPAGRPPPRPRSPGRSARPACRPEFRRGIGIVAPRAHPRPASTRSRSSARTARIPPGRPICRAEPSQKPASPMIASIIATGTCRNFGSIPAASNSNSPCSRAVSAGPGPPMGRTRFALSGSVRQACDEPAEVVVADRFAGRERPVPEQQERLARPHPRDLPRQRLEEGRGPHDGIGQARRDQPSPRRPVSHAGTPAAASARRSPRAARTAPDAGAFAASSATTCASWSMAQASRGAPVREARQDTTASNRPAVITVPWPPHRSHRHHHRGPARQDLAPPRIAPRRSRHAPPPPARAPPLSGRPRAAQQQHAHRLMVEGVVGRTSGQLRSGSAVNLT